MKPAVPGAGVSEIETRRTWTPGRERRRLPRALLNACHRGHTAAVLLSLLPGALIVILGFHAGGFFPGAVGATAAGFALLLVGHVTLAERPFVGLSVPYLVATGAFGLFAVWTLASAAWSDSPSRAILEYDRALLYLLPLVVFGAFGRTEGLMRWMVRGLAAGAFLVCACGLITRLLPDIWSTSAEIANDRLSYPVTYWNALGLLAAMGLVFSFSLTSDARERPVVRTLAAAALPVLAATLLLTFSRGSMAAAAVGLVAVIIVGRPGALLSGLVVAGPAITIAVAAAYGADLLATDRPTTPAAVAQGHDVAVVVAVCAVMAAVARALLVRVDARLLGVRPPSALRRPAVVVGVVVAGLLALGGAAAATGIPERVEDQYDRFVATDSVRPREGDLRTRLANPGNNGRLFQWRVGIDAFRAEPVRGHGAGTYALLWDRHRPDIYQVEDAHSLYVETLAELGVVGLALLAGALLLMLAVLLARCRGPDRMVYAAPFAAGLAWALHAGVDWDWEMPVVTLWFFAAAGMALASRLPQPPRRGAMPRTARLLVALGILVLAVVPVRILLSQDALEQSRAAFMRGDCRAAVEHALDASAALTVRPEPFVILGYCDVRLGIPRLGVRALEKAISRDPQNWENHYGLAVVRAAAGLDPRGAIRRARQLNPGSGLVQRTARMFDTTEPREWRSRALRAQLPTS